jgi:hypothetical protein
LALALLRWNIIRIEALLAQDKESTMLFVPISERDFSLRPFIVSRAVIAVSFSFWTNFILRVKWIATIPDSLVPRILPCPATLSSVAET